MENMHKPKLNKREEKDRGALLKDIHKGRRLEKVVRSAPVLEGESK